MVQVVQYSKYSHFLARAVSSKLAIYKRILAYTFLEPFSPFDYFVGTLGDD